MIALINDAVNPLILKKRRPSPIVHMDHLSAAGSSATRNLTTTEPSESLNRRKTVDFRFQRPYATSGSFFFNKPMRAMDSRRDFTSKKVFSGYFSELGEKANSALQLGIS